MIKVPKAGRPLAKCPHPKGSCSCQKTYAFMVRIPKGDYRSIMAMIFTDPLLGSTCLCRPLYKVPGGSEESSQPTTASVPQVASPSSGKVQKSGRRQSHIQAAPESIAKALEAISDNLKGEEFNPNISARPSPYETPGQNGFDSNDISKQNSTPSSMPREGQPTPQGATERSCCSQKPDPPPLVSNGGSCSSGKSTARSTADATPNNAHGSIAPPNTWSDLPYMNYSTSRMPTWQNAANQPQPLQPPGMHNSQAQPPYMRNYTPNIPSTPYTNMMDGLGISQPAMSSFPSNHMQNPGFTSISLGSDPCHDCKCGEDCQCLGCAAHPFNNTTRQHVQEMGVLMTFDDDEHTPEAITSGYQSPFFQSNPVTTPSNFFSQHSSSMSHPLAHDAYDPYSDPHSTMPNGYSSPLQTDHSLNQQLMHTSEYYTLEYPVGIPGSCSDVTGSCQCGSDCSCVGCLTHSGHNGVPLEAPVPESSVPRPTEQHFSSHVSSTTNSTGQTSRNPVLGDVSLPCMSPRPLETSMI